MPEQKSLIERMQERIDILGGTVYCHYTNRITVDLMAEAIKELKKTINHASDNTVTIRYDLSAVAVEEKLRAKLIEMGWTPP